MDNISDKQLPSIYHIQKTLKATVRLAGVGLHTGEAVSIRLLPAPANHGIIFHRTDVKPPVQIMAHYDSVVCTKMATTLGNEAGIKISTVEHLLSALFALGVTNLTCEVDGPEIPILDGSARPFIEAILDAGIDAQPFSQTVFRVVRPIRVYQNGAVCELLPRDNLRITTSVDFPHPSIGLQTCALDVTPVSFAREIGPARTFGFEQDVEKLKSLGLARGASLSNVLAFSSEGILNPEGSRFNDECVRHKILDAIGDLALCGSWIEGELVSFRGGHSIHLALLRAVRNHPSHWNVLPAEPIPSPRLTQPTWADDKQPIYLT